MPEKDGIFEDVSSDTSPAPPCIFVLFGATGDLAARKIAPALYNLRRARLLADNTGVLGVARRKRTDQQFRNEMLSAVKEHSRNQPVDPQIWSYLARNCFYHSVEAGDTQGYASLRKRLDELDENLTTGGNRLFYVATTPDTFESVVGRLGQAGLASLGSSGGLARIVIEKPFGRDLDSARRLNSRLLASFKESQIYRIDHYLGKETVQNILVLRFANSIFEPILNREHVDHVQITTAEEVGMEGRRGPYYESAGALRDMVQNHLMQLLALTAMEAPATMNGDDIRTEKVKVLRSIKTLAAHEVACCSVRGQYGPSEGISGYLDEEGVAPDSQVETYAAIKLYVDNWRWANVPFYLRTGKRLTRKASQILIAFRREPISMFTEMGCDFRDANKLAIRIFPDEGVNIVVDAKVPGVRMLLRPVKMDFQYDCDFGSGSPEAYEHLLLDAMQGDQTLFLRSDEVEASWRYIDSIRSGWDRTGNPALVRYTPGTWGPEEADRLFGNAYMKWQPV